MTNDTRISIRLDSQTLDTLKRLAAQDDRSLSSVVRRAVRRAAEPQAEPADARIVRELMGKLPK